MRYPPIERLTLVGEAYALLHHGKNGMSANGHFNGGAQLAVHERLLFSALLGSSVHADGPDLTAVLSFTWVVDVQAPRRMGGDRR